MKKAPIAVALVLVFGLFAAVVSLSPAIAQYASNPPPTDTETAGAGNATDTNATGTNQTAAQGSTFSAEGSIAGLIFSAPQAPSNETSTNQTSTNMTSSGNTTAGNTTTSATGDLLSDSGLLSTNVSSTLNATTNATTTSEETTTAAHEASLPYVVSGNWSLDVQDGNVSEFNASMTMVHTDGTGRHTHDITSFNASTSSIEMVEDGVIAIFGTADVSKGNDSWTGVDTIIVIERMNAASISLTTDDDHFQGQPLYGIVDSLTDENGNEMIQTTEQSGNATQTAEDMLNQTGDGLGDVGEGVEDFFNGTS